MQSVCQSADNCHVSLGPVLLPPAITVRLSVCVETVNRQPSCLVSSGETVESSPITDVPDMLSTRRCNRFIRHCRRLVVIGFHSVNRPPSSPYRIGQHPFQPSFSSPCRIGFHSVTVSPSSPCRIGLLPCMSMQHPVSCQPFIPFPRSVLCCRCMSHFTSLFLFCFYVTVFA